MMRIRNRIFQQFKFTNSIAILKALKQFQTLIVNKLRESKKIDYNQYFDENINKMKMLWKGIKSIVNHKSNKHDTISYVEDNNSIQIKDPGGIPNKFNYFFTNVANDNPKKFPRTRKSPLSYLSSPNSAFFVSPCISDEVKSIIKSLKNVKSCGSNSIPIKLLKMLSPKFLFISPLYSIKLSELILSQKNLKWIRLSQCTRKAGPHIKSYHYQIIDQFFCFLCSVKSLKSNASSSL